MPTVDPVTLRLLLKQVTIQALTIRVRQAPSIGLLIIKTCSYVKAPIGCPRGPYNTAQTFVYE